MTFYEKVRQSQSCTAFRDDLDEEEEALLYHEANPYKRSTGSQPTSLNGTLNRHYKHHRSSRHAEHKAKPDVPMQCYNILAAKQVAPERSISTGMLKDMTTKTNRGRHAGKSNASSSHLYSGQNQSSRLSSSKKRCLPTPPTAHIAHVKRDYDGMTSHRGSGYPVIHPETQSHHQYKTSDESSNGDESSSNSDYTKECIELSSAGQAHMYQPPPSAVHSTTFSRKTYHQDEMQKFSSSNESFTTRDNYQRRPLYRRQSSGTLAGRQLPKINSDRTGRRATTGEFASDRNNSCDHFEYLEYQNQSSSVRQLPRMLPDINKSTAPSTEWSSSTKLPRRKIWSDSRARKMGRSADMANSVELADCRPLRQYDGSVEEPEITEDDSYDTEEEDDDISVDFNQPSVEQAENLYRSCRDPIIDPPHSTKKQQDGMIQRRHRSYKEDMYVPTDDPGIMFTAVPDTDFEDPLLINDTRSRPVYHQGRKVIHSPTYSSSEADEKPPNVYHHQPRSHSTNNHNSPHHHHQQQLNYPYDRELDH